MSILPPNLQKQTAVNHFPMNALETIFPGKSEMAKRMREFDWTKTPLGPVEQWPEALKVSVHITLTARHPMFVWWGDELIHLYNDAYALLLHQRHPWALGQPAKIVWPEIWHQFILPRIERALLHDEGTYDEVTSIILEHKGYPEEMYATFSYSPIPDNEKGGIGGIICPVTEETERIISERQMALLRELSTKNADAKTWQDACLLSAVAFETNRHDFPFVMIYVVDMDQQVAQLISVCGIERGHELAPENIQLEKDTPWQFDKVMQTNQLCLITDLKSISMNIPLGTRQFPPAHAVALPIATTGKTGKACILVVGLNPLRQFNQNYRRFLELVSSQIAAAIANGQAYEEEKKRAEALAEIDRAKTTFFSNVSHEFRTPLTLMLGPLEDVMASVSDKTISPQLQIIHRNSLRLLKLVNTLLDFSRIEAGRVQACYEPIDLTALTTDLASIFRAAIERAGLSYIVNCIALPESVYIDKEMWEKIILNLLSNAFKFTFEGKITVTLTAENNNAKLIIQDTGIGIAEKELTAIFDRFHRVENTRSRTFEGSGIGLSLVRELVNLHGGQISVTSQLDVGTTFEIVIPFGNAHLPVEQIKKSSNLPSTNIHASIFVEESLSWLPSPVEMIPPNNSVVVPSEFPNAKILVVDDNADMRQYLSQLISPHWNVKLATNGQEALSMLQQSPFDLILTDIMMPILDGINLLKNIRADAQLKNIPVIFLSARAGEEASVEGLEAGADDYLIKPFSAREVLIRIETHLKVVSRNKLVVEKEVLRIAKEEAERANQAKDLFLATLSHELRTPLSVILLWAQLLKSGNSDLKRIHHGLITIEECALAQNQLINDLLDISKISLGKLSIELKNINLIDTLLKTIATIKPSAEKKLITIKENIAFDIVFVNSDRSRLQQIFWNILSNAIKFTPAKGCIEIGISLSADKVIISFSDTGKGVKPEFLPYIFDRFSQADASTTRRHGGLGIGLAIVKSLLELQGGAIDADSPGENQGTRFTVTLPILKNHFFEQLDFPMTLPLSYLSNNKFSSLKNIKILYVDDQPHTGDAIAYVISSFDAQIYLAYSVKEALHIYQNIKPDIIISDIAMPDEDGYSLIRKIRIIEKQMDWNEVPAIALTAHANQEHLEIALAAGFQTYLTKPINMMQIIEAIIQFIGIPADTENITSKN